MNVANLKKLADYLDALPDDYDHFDMGVFFESKRGGDEHRPTTRAKTTTCGTVACAVGHGPSAGIPAKHSDYGWDEYSDRVFALTGDDWQWCFGCFWPEVDNTAKGAAARIRYLIKHGRPDNSEDQAEGNAPLSYQVSA